MTKGLICQTLARLKRLMQTQSLSDDALCVIDFSSLRYTMKAKSRQCGSHVCDQVMQMVAGTTCTVEGRKGTSSWKDAQLRKDRVKSDRNYY